MSENHETPNRWRVFLAGHLDRILSALALGAAVVALLLSWNANRIAFQQLPSRIAVLEITPIPHPDQNIDWHERGCAFFVQVANLGEPSDSIIGYEVLVEYRGNTVQLETIDAEIPTAETFEYLVPGISHFRTVLVMDLVMTEGTLYTQPDYANAANWENFPIDLVSHTSVNLPFILVFSKDISVISLESPENAEELLSPDGLGEWSPIKFSINFRLASGQSVSSPQGLCFYAKEKFDPFD